MRWIKLFLLIYTGFISFDLYAQSIYFEPRAMYDFYFVEGEEGINLDNISYTDGRLYGYEHPIGKMRLSIEYLSNYNDIAAPVVNDTFERVFGTIITKSHIITLGVNRKYNIYGKLSFGWSASIRNVWIKRLYEDNTDCQLRQQEEYDYQACNNLTAYPGLKIEPTANVFLDFAFLDQLHIYMTLGITKGFSKYQEIEIKYKYKGIDRPNVKSYSNGTGYYFGIGMKYDLPKKDVVFGLFKKGNTT